jgi:hypothetical protein
VIDMGLKDKLMKFDFVKDSVLSEKYGSNIHDMGLDENIEKDLVGRLMTAREVDIPYCVVFGGIIPMGKNWDPYGNGEWNPSRDYITTEDIATEDKDLELERQNIYAFLRGEEIVKDKAQETGRHR